MVRLKSLWDERLPKRGKQLHGWIKTNHEATMRDYMLKKHRIAAGLGDPPKQFTTNRVESVNNLLKIETNGPLPINQCVQKIKELVERQQRNVESAICGKGSYEVHEDYSSLKVDQCEWMNLTEVFIKK